MSGLSRLFVYLICSSPSLLPSTVDSGNVAVGNSAGLPAAHLLRLFNSSNSNNYRAETFYSFCQFFLFILVPSNTYEKMQQGLQTVGAAETIELDGVVTHVTCIEYSDRIFLSISQRNSFGVLMSVSTTQYPDGVEEQIARVLLGEREEDFMNLAGQRIQHMQLWVMQARLCGRMSKMARS